MIVIDIASGDLVTMVGSADPTVPVDGQVNGVLAARNPGSTLKPFLYAAAFDARRLAADSVVDDMPIERAGWSPQKFDGTFQGSVSAAEALQRSLNIPAIPITWQLGLPLCAGVLNAVGIPLPNDTTQRGGLALTVGAVEVTLLDLTNGYATLGRDGVRRAPRLYFEDKSTSHRVLDPTACATVNEILSSGKREPRLRTTSTPVAVAMPRRTPWFMWKTGTSSGRRDAWAVGHNRRFAIGVWVGRFSGSGHSSLVGRDAAEPLLRTQFESPQFRSCESPSSPPALRVENPLSRRDVAAINLHIAVPADGSVFVANDGRAIVHSRLNRPERVTWFLNDRFLPPSEADRLELIPGSYQ